MRRRQLVARLASDTQNDRAAARPGRPLVQVPIQDAFPVVAEWSTVVVGIEGVARDIPEANLLQQSSQGAGLEEERVVQRVHRWSCQQVADARAQEAVH